jgi:sulfatase modifying factor 1
VDFMSTCGHGKIVCEKLIEKITRRSADSYGRDLCPNRSVVECMVIDAAASSRERGHLARFGACGGVLPGILAKCSCIRIHSRSSVSTNSQKPHFYPCSRGGGAKVTALSNTYPAMKSPKLLTLAATAALITSASASATIDWVTVGNAGNAADSTGYGAVGYSYQIGKYEVTNAQYGAFLNAAAQTDSYGLYNSEMSSYGITQSGSSGSYTYSVTTALADRPVVYVSWFDAARMANWMVNGQGGGSTETGAYTLNGATSGTVLANAGAQVYIPTEDEWYKAAYYNAASQTYSLYANGQNTITTADANYGSSVGSSTDVGFYTGDPSMYGTFDQGGNLSEWYDAVFYGFLRGLRGGSLVSSDLDMASSTRNFYAPPEVEGANIGFRLATAVPEPSSLVLTMLASSAVLIRRKR